MKYQLILILVAVFLILGLYNLPKVVVNNKDKKLNTNSEQSLQTNPKQESQHPKLSDKNQKKLDSLKKELKNLDSEEKKANFANSISDLYKSVSQFDSAAHYMEVLYDIKPNLKNLIKTGDAYYEAFQFAINANKASKLGQKARDFYQKVLKKKPNDLRVKANLAMTYTATPNPMQGIGMLKSILEEDSKNELAIFNLGILSMQSGQYDKAVDRFKKLLIINPNNIQAKFFLGESFANLGKKQEAIRVFEEIATLKTDTIPQYKDAAKSFLQQLK